MVILVVDTVSLVRRNLDRLLSSHGHEVISADSGDTALEILKRDHRIRLVITDSRIGGMTATELYKANGRIERISDNGDSSPPKFILLTHMRPDSELNGRGEQVLQEAVDLGFVDILFKPLVRDELLGHVRQIAGNNPQPEESLKGETTTESGTPLTEKIDQLYKKNVELEQKVEEMQSKQGDVDGDLLRAKKWMRIFISDK